MTSSAANPFPYLPLTGIQFPTTPLILSSYHHAKKFATPGVLNHVLRSAAFCLLLQKKIPEFAELGDSLDIELVVVSCLLHDLAWSKAKELVTNTRRFEVDSANLSREFIHAASEKDGTWEQGSRRMQIAWDAIALHTMETIAPWKEPEVALVHFGVHGDLLGPNLHLLGLPEDLPNLEGVITEEEFKEISKAFPRMHFADEFKEIFGGLCRDRGRYSFDSNVEKYGLEWGYDGKGARAEEFKKLVEYAQRAKSLYGVMSAVDKLLDEA
ncbi:metal dependent phosphohydrolase [Fusarium napiforme]|uniref:Metal dependent phosphohydrolase n=1 Tax=Fusarium napiforme TaxID=42672 RepID=A0A8H5JSJ4_9HYPO|nr:metal dependent phosphohydrolase [Fusarium napiforme]